MLAAAACEGAEQGHGCLLGWGVLVQTVLRLCLLAGVNSACSAIYSTAWSGTQLGPDICLPCYVVLCRACMLLCSRVRMLLRSNWRLRAHHGQHWAAKPLRSACGHGRKSECSDWGQATEVVLFSTHFVSVC